MAQILESQLSRTKTKIGSSDQIRKLGLLPADETLLCNRQSVHGIFRCGWSEPAKMSRLGKVIGWEGKGWLVLGFVRLGLVTLVWVVYHGIGDVPASSVQQESYT
jgi:hypothetical protein